MDFHLLEHTPVMYCVVLCYVVGNEWCRQTVVITSHSLAFDDNKIGMWQ